MIAHAVVCARGRFAAGVCALAFCCGLAPASARANVLYNFNQSGDGWSSTTTPAWTWSQDASNEGSWKAFCNSSAFVSYLYSPCLEVNNPVHPAPSSVDIDFQHRFNFQTGTTGFLWGAGQVQYMVNNSGTWQGITTWSSSGGELPPTSSPPPGYTVPPLLDPGAYFAWTSPKYANTGAGGVFDKSSFQVSGLSVGDVLQFRFAAAMFVSGVCPSPIDPRGQNPIWDLDDFEIKGAIECVPEPGSIALAGSGMLVGGIALMRRRWARRLPAPAAG